MNGTCICDSPNMSLRNIHCEGRELELSLISDDEGYGIVIFDKGEAIGVFNIDYCPSCGKRLLPNFY